MNKPDILVIDDEPQIQKLLKIVLENSGYRVEQALSGLEGISLAASVQPGLILLDIGLPDRNGIEILMELKQWFANPIIMLSVVNSEMHIVKALDIGAEDYVTKPFRTGELLARIRTALRRNSRSAGNSKILAGRLGLDLEARSITLDGDYLKLTTTEYNLLSLFMRNEGKVLTHNFLLKEIWGPGFQNETQYLRVFVAQLRKKIEINPNEPVQIITESGVGYRFVGNGATHA